VVEVELAAWEVEGAVQEMSVALAVLEVVEAESALVALASLEAWVEVAPEVF